MIIVHHLDNSRSLRVLWLLEELGCPYEIVEYKRDKKTMLAPASLAKIHPLGKSPVIVDDGRTIAESGAIIEYLIETYGQGRLAPRPGTPERLRYIYWLHYAEGSAMPLLLLKLLFSLLPGNAPFVMRPVVRLIAKRVQDTFIDPQLKKHVAFWSEELISHPWFAGDEFTAADIQMSFPVEAAAARLGIAKNSPLFGFLDRIHARPAYQRALQRGGPLTLFR
jgi:glutathione S-transferase